MYWSRSSILDIFPFLLSLGLYALGGWLLATHVVRQPRRGRLLLGITLGLTLSIPLTALLTQFLPFVSAWWAAAGLTLAGGLLAAKRRNPKTWLSFKDITAALPALLAFFVLTALFTLMNRGLAIFDDYHNLPLISTIAAGDAPPHFYLNSGLDLHYHFGLHLFAAALVRIGGFFPWSAYDLANALFLALTLILAWRWFRRAAGSTWAGWMGSAALALVGGVRWLLPALPENILNELNGRITLQGSALATAETFAAALNSPWNIEGGGPVPFAFVHAPGILAPLVQSMTGSGAFPVLIPVLLLLTLRRRPSWPEVVLAALLLAALALTAETVFVVLLLGGLAAAILLTIQQKKLDTKTWGLLLEAGLLALVQGGVLSGMVRGLLAALTGQAASGAGYDGFALHWPPAVLSVHFGRLSLFDPLQWPVALAELGPAILLGPSVTACTWRRLRNGDWLSGAFGLGALIAFTLPLVLHYHVERDTTRITAVALTTWLLLGIPWLWRSWKALRKLVRIPLGLALTAGAVSGVALFSVELQAIPAPQQSYFIDGMDARLSSEFWNALPPEAQVFDPLPFRAVTLFGRPADTHTALRQPLPEYESLVENFTPVRAATYGFDYLYVDSTWYWRLSSDERGAFEQDCVLLLQERVNDMGEFRRLYDVSACRTE